MAGAAINRSARVEAKGLAELRRSMRQMGDRELMREFAKNNQALAEYVAKKARIRAIGVGNMQERAANDAMKAMRTAAAARIELRPTRRTPYALGAEFGAEQNERRRVRSADGSVRFVRGWNQFRPWAGNALTTGGRGGYFLFPTIRAERDEIVDRYVQSLEAFVDKNIPDGPKLTR